MKHFVEPPKHTWTSGLPFQELILERELYKSEFLQAKKIEFEKSREKKERVGDETCPILGIGMDKALQNSRRNVRRYLGPLDGAVRGEHVAELVVSDGPGDVPHVELPRRHLSRSLEHR